MSCRDNGIDVPGDDNDGGGGGGGGGGGRGGRGRGRGRRGRGGRGRGGDRPPRNQDGEEQNGEEANGDKAEADGSSGMQVGSMSKTLSACVQFLSLDTHCFFVGLHADEICIPSVTRCATHYPQSACRHC